MQEKELEEFEREQMALAVREQTAENHRNRVLKRAVYKAMKRHTKMVKQEREIEKVHESRKCAIDEFFVNLKERARIEEERLKKEKLEKL